LFNGFNDPKVYSDGTIQMWVTLAQSLVNPDRWAELTDYGVSLWVAHRLALIQRDVLTARAGGIPGAVQGVLSAKAVDKVSASYDVSKIQLDNAGDLNMTSYGIQFATMRRQMGAGGMQVCG
jgi:hypothetical protein